MFHIGRAGAKLGSFSQFEVSRGLKTGRFFLTDLGWKPGMENWAPLSEFEEFNPPPEPMPPLPDAEPEEEEAATGAGETQPPGLPWDFRRERGFPRAFVETAKMIISNPREAYARMPCAGSLAGPMLYNLIGGWFGLICSGLYLVLMSNGEPPPPASMGAWGSLFYFTPERAMQELQLFIFLGPVAVTLSALISAGIAHLLLMLSGGATQPYHVTLRVFCYTYGSVQLLQVLPVLGSLLAPALWVVYCVLGLAIAHRTSPWRSVTAMGLFLLAGLACVFAMVFSLVALAQAGVHP